MKSKLEKLKSNRFARNFVKLFSATLLAQVITILLSPVLTRLYSPEDFGLYSVYMAIVSLVIVYATGRYEFAISTVKTTEDSVTLLKLVVAMSVISSLILFVIILPFKNLLNALLGFSADNNMLYYVPLTILILGIMQGLNYYFNREKDFTNISRAKILQSVGTGGTSISFAFMNFHTMGMIWANLIGMLVANLYNVSKSKIWRFFNPKSYNFSQLKQTAFKHKQYPLWNSTSAFFDVLALQAPVLVFNRFFADAIVGFYSLTVRVVALPVSLISSAVAQVYLSELAEKERNGEPIDQIVKKAAKVLAVIGIFPVFILVAFGPTLFGLVFGEEWRQAGELAQILAFAYYAKFIVSPLSVVFFVKGAIKELSRLQFFRAVSTLVVLIVSSVFFDSLFVVVLIYSLHEILFYIVYWWLIDKVTKG